MACEIELARGTGVTVVDDDVYEWASLRSWHLIPHRFTGYARMFDGRRSVYLHCAILGRRGIDHINGDGLDNRRSNLRPATHQENMRNMRKRPGCSSRFKGVYFDPRGSSAWRAEICVDGRKICLGGHPDEVTAAAAYNLAAAALFGDFAKLNELT